jgi:flagellar motor component MotA
LEHFNLYESTIKELPGSIGDLENLAELYLDTTPVDKLPDSIGNLKKLERLEMSRSTIKELPNSMGNLQSLKRLVLQYNDNLTSLPETLVNCATLEFLDIFGTHIQSVPEFNPSVTVINLDPIRMIPDDPPSYRGFVNGYYKLLKRIVQFSNKARREGLLALEDELEYLADDLFIRGIRLVVDGTDCEVIRRILTILIEHEHDFYRKKLMEIAMEGILLIQNGAPPYQLIIFLNSLVAIKDNPIDLACAKYFASGDLDILTKIDLDLALHEEDEREEIRFIKRVIELSEKCRREGILALEGDLDHEGIADRDVFEYGLPMAIDAYEPELIEKILSNLIAHETDPVRRNVALAKKEALLSICAGDNPRLLLMKLLAYFDESITKGVKAYFDD